MKTTAMLILDESGSMMTTKPQTVSGLTEFIETLKNNAGDSIRVSLVKFNSEHTEKVWMHAPVRNITEFPAESYQPAGLTPLYDAIGVAIASLEKEIAQEKNVPAVLCVILTDGLENASKEYTRAQIHDLIEHKTAEGWKFVYIGANQDSWLEGGAIGMMPGATLNYTANANGTSIGWATISDSTVHFARSAEAGNVMASSAFFAAADPEAVEEHKQSILKRAKKESGQWTS